MDTIYVATSKGLQEWGADHGLTKNLFKLGLAEGKAQEAVDRLNADKYGGHADWKLIKTQKADGVDEETAIKRVAARERLVDPGFYPGLKGATGVFKVRMEGVVNHLLVKATLAGNEPKIAKVKPADIALYLIQSALADPALKAASVWGPGAQN
ncbi:MAG: hypothetical protein ACT4N4_00940 [Rhodospirillales bacterium]